MNLNHIEIVSFSAADDSFLRTISQNLGKIFPYAIKTKQEHMELIAFYDASRKQYNADLLLNFIEDKYAAANYKTIALFNVDLFIPIFTYIFGQAGLNGNCGVVSCHRFYSEQYGMPVNKQVFADRFLKEIIHELGHCFGLVHCFSADCVMRSGSYVEEIDLKKTGFCNKCKKELAQKFQTHLFD